METSAKTFRISDRPISPVGACGDPPGTSISPPWSPVGRCPPGPFPHFSATRSAPPGAQLGDAHWAPSPSSVSCRISPKTRNGQPSLQNWFRAMIFEAISSFRDKRKLLPKRFEVRTNQSLRLASAKNGQERAFFCFHHFCTEIR